MAEAKQPSPMLIGSVRKKHENDLFLTSNCSQKTTIDQTILRWFYLSHLRVYSEEKLEMYPDVPKRYLDFCDLPIRLCHATYSPYDIGSITEVKNWTLELRIRTLWDG